MQKLPHRYRAQKAIARIPGGKGFAKKIFQHYNLVSQFVEQYNDITLAQLRKRIYQ